MILADPHVLLRRFMSDHADSHASLHGLVIFPIPASEPPAADAAIGDGSGRA